MNKSNDINGAQPRHGLDYHAWPAPGEHLWSEWMANTARVSGPDPKPPTQWRTCLHPHCNATEVRDYT